MANASANGSGGCPVSSLASPKPTTPRSAYFTAIVGLIDRVGRVDGAIGGDDDAHPDVVRAGRVGGSTENDLERLRPAARCGRCGGAGTPRARSTPRRRAAASSITSRVSRASASGEVRMAQAAWYMPENAEKLPNPRIGRHLEARFGGHLVQRFRAHRAFEMDVQVGFRKVAEIAHDADHGMPRGRIRSAPRRAPKRCVNDRRTAPKLRAFYGAFNKSLSGLPGRCRGPEWGGVCVRRIRSTRALAGSAVVPAARCRGRCRDRVAGDGRDVGDPRRVR